MILDSSEQIASFEYSLFISKMMNFPLLVLNSDNFFSYSSRIFVKVADTTWGSKSGNQFTPQERSTGLSAVNRKVWRPLGA